jgi:hypothetical protein
MSHTCSITTEPRIISQVASSQAPVPANDHLIVDEDEGDEHEGHVDKEDGDSELDKEKYVPKDSVHYHTRTIRFNENGEDSEVVMSATELEDSTITKVDALIDLSYAQERIVSSSSAPSTTSIGSARQNTDSIDTVTLESFVGIEGSASAINIVPGASNFTEARSENTGPEMPDELISPSPSLASTLCSEPVTPHTHPTDDLSELVFIYKATLEPKASAEIVVAREITCEHDEANVCLGKARPNIVRKSRAVHVVAVAVVNLGENPQ